MIKRLLILSFSILVFASCDDDDDFTNELVKSYRVMLSSANSIPMVEGRDETGIIDMYLYRDNSLEFNITIDNLSFTDELTTAHVHFGDVVSTGDVAISLVDGNNIAFTGDSANGMLSLSASQAASLQGDDVCVNVHSMESPSGLVRGQIDMEIDYAYNIALSPDHEVPPVMGRNETGVAIFRIVNSTMYYKVTVDDLDTSDDIIGAHIHEGAVGANGDVLINLGITDNDQLDMTKSLTLSSEELTSVNNDALYVNVHSNQVPSGLIRGQIR